MLSVLMLLPFVKKFFARMAIAVVLTTVLSSAGIVVVNDMINARFDALKRKNVNVANDTGSSEPANFLLIGSDTRAFATSEEDKESFTDNQGVTGQRSDSMMIIHVEPKLQKTIVMAIPRDTVVDIPGIGRQKINASFNVDLGGGPDKVIETIQSNFDVPIQHYVELDFDSFRQIVNALGTVNVYFPAPARDKKSGLDTQMKSGCLPLNGDSALSYVRSRYYERFIDGKWQIDPTSDFGRIERQQAFMQRVASLAVSKSLADPIKGRKVADAVLKKLVVDQNLKKDDIFKLMNAFKGVDPNDPTHVQFQTLPTKPISSGLGVKTAEAEPMLAELRNFSTPSSRESTTTLPRPGTVKVRVLNASGVKGAAATAMASLQDIGFAPAGTGNASSRSSTEVHYSGSDKAKATLVAKYVGGKLVQDSAIADADVVVMLGDDFTSVNAKGEAKKALVTTAKASQTTKPTATTANNAATETECPA